MTNPLDDTSRWTMISSRYETPQFLIDGLRQMFRDCFGDEVADAMEATVPPPMGTYTGSWEDSAFNQSPYTIDGLRWFTDARGERHYY